MRVDLFASSARKPVPNDPAPHRATSGLGLRVQAENDRLLVSWDRDLSAVENAAKGSLSIDDGLTHRQIELDGEQVANGSVLYKPHSDDVSFRLQVVTGAGATAQDSVRVLGDSGLPGMNRIARVSLPQNEVPGSGVPATTDSKMTNQTPLPDLAPSGKPAASLSTAYNPAPVVVQRAQIAFAKPPIDVGLPGPAGNVYLPQYVPAPVPAMKTQAAQPPLPQPQITQPQVTRTQVTQPQVAFEPPEPLKRVSPTIKASDLGSLSPNFETDLRVHIDEKGRVTNVNIVKGGFNSVFNALVMQAAESWAFAPARLHGKPVPSDYVIVFRFKPAS